MGKKKLTGKQTRYLRGLGHHLSPVVMIGREGISENLIASTKEALAARELIKVKLQENCPLHRKEAAELLAQKTRSSLAQVIGKTFLLFLENKELKDDIKIHLPE